MRVYLAGRYSRKDEFRGVAATLRSRGLDVTSRWLEENNPADTKMGDDTDEFYTKSARVDLEDIDRSDAVLFFAEDPLVGTPRGGRHVEFGYALARGKYIDVIGPKENVFHHVDNGLVYNFTTLQQYLDFIGAVPVRIGEVTC